MKVYTRILFAILVLFMFPLFSFATTTPLVAAGIPKDQIWFSQDPFFAGEEITVYSLIYNSSPFQFSGTLEMFDGKTPIGKKDFTISSGGASVVIAFPWRATQGNHSFSGTLVSNEILSSDKQLVPVRVETPTTLTAKRFADFDTDGDRIGNLQDADDDNDGLSDKQEKILGTNPQIPDTDGDGAFDGVDKQPLKKNSPDELASSSPPVVFQIPAVTKNDTSKPPAPIFPTSTPVLGVVESFRVINEEKSVHYREEARGAVLASRGNSSSTENGDRSMSEWQLVKSGVTDGYATKSPFAYAKLMLFMAYELIVSHTYIYYPILMYGVYTLLRILFGLLRRRK